MKKQYIPLSVILSLIILFLVVPVKVHAGMSSERTRQHWYLTIFPTVTPGLTPDAPTATPTVTPTTTPTPSPFTNSTTNTNTNANINRIDTDAVMQPASVSYVVQPQAANLPTQLPQTGVPLAAYGILSLLPLGVIFQRRATVR